MLKTTKFFILYLTFHLVHISSANFKDECLETHNKLREKHRAPALDWDDGIAKFAQEWADTLKGTGVMRHRGSDTQKYGENLYMTSAKGANGIDPTQAWYDEIKDYDFSKPGFSMATGHFTQVIWVDSARLGCGIGVGDKGTFVVCNYEPAGNIEGSFAQNVLSRGTSISQHSFLIYLIKCIVHYYQHLWLLYHATVSSNCD